MKDRLEQILKNMGRTCLAYSGGVDSHLLLHVAHSVLGSNFSAITVRGGMTADYEIKRAKETLEILGIQHRIIDIDEMSIQGFVENSPQRCYHCKKAIFGLILEQSDGAQVIDGSNLDDDGDYRPGMKALREYGVRSPLKEAGLTKSDVRKLSRELGLVTADIPSNACYATRIPYGTPITRELMNTVAQAEKILHNKRISPCRVRHYGDTARIEADPKAVIDADIINQFKTLGFTYVTIDLEGFKSGSMNNGVLKGIPHNG